MIQCSGWIRASSGRQSACGRTDGENCLAITGKVALVNDRRIGADVVLELGHVANVCDGPPGSSVQRKRLNCCHRHRGIPPAAWSAGSGNREGDFLFAWPELLPVSSQDRSRHRFARSLRVNPGHAGGFTDVARRTKRPGRQKRSGRARSFALARKLIANGRRFGTPHLVTAQRLIPAIELLTTRPAAVG
jgi:hypothetical protein